MKREELETLSKEDLIELVLQLAEIVAKLREQDALLAERVAELEAELAGKRPPKDKQRPDWVKPNKPKSTEKKERKKRQHNFVRRREEPTKRVQHAASECPRCHCALTGGWVKRRRQVLHIPIPRVEVIEHEIIARRCPRCHDEILPKLDLSSQVIGKHRVSIETMSLIATLRAVGRLPLETIQSQLSKLHGLDLSIGELVAVLHKVAAMAKPVVETIKEEVRTSPVVNADETGWREDGHNGYVWTFNTPKARYFTRRQSRSGKLVNEVLGEDFEGCLVSDFYAGYNRMDGRHQRCWVHFFRDIRELLEENPEDDKVRRWAARVHEVYRRAKSFVGNEKDRAKAQHRFERLLSRICRPFVKKDAPQRVLCERVERYLPEMFSFVADPRVPSDNNAAERSLRPLVIARKISGGTRSAAGSETRMALASAFGTWLLRGVNPYSACSDLLTSPRL